MGPIYFHAIFYFLMEWRFKKSVLKFSFELNSNRKHMPNKYKWTYKIWRWFYYYLTLTKSIFMVIQNLCQFSRIKTQLYPWNRQQKTRCIIVCFAFGNTLSSRIWFLFTIFTHNTEKTKTAKNDLIKKWNPKKNSNEEYDAWACVWQCNLISSGSWSSENKKIVFHFYSNIFLDFYNVI